MYSLLTQIPQQEHRQTDAQNLLRQRPDQKQVSQTETVHRQKATQPGPAHRQQIRTKVQSQPGGV